MARPADPSPGLRADVARAGLADLLQAAKDLQAAVDNSLAAGKGLDTAGRELLGAMASRLRASVTRPLATAAARIDSKAAPPLADPAPAVGDPPAAADGSGAKEPAASLGARLLGLAVEATRLQATGSMPLEVHEAAAALQDLAVRARAGPGTGGSALAELKDIVAGLPAAIQVQPDGPYLVTNVETVTDWLGVPVAARPLMALCRCGVSAMKPWCDGSHARFSFTGAKDPSRVPDRRTAMPASR